MFKYDFQCEDCKCYFEWYLPHEKRNDPVQCPLCPSLNTVRLISAPIVMTNKQGKEDVSAPDLSAGGSCGVGCGCCPP